MRGKAAASFRPTPNRLWQPTTARWFAVVFGASLAYGIVRYHFVKDVPWVDFPLFILNNVTDLAAVVFVACSYLVGRTIKWHNDAPIMRLVVVKFCGREHTHTIGINWACNWNTRVMLNYLLVEVEDGPRGSGTIHILGLRMRANF